MMIPGNLERNPSAPKGSWTYNLPISSFGALPCTELETRGSTAIKLGSLISLSYFTAISNSWKRVTSTGVGLIQLSGGFNIPNESIHKHYMTCRIWVYCINWSALWRFLSLRKAVPPQVKNLRLFYLCLRSPFRCRHFSRSISISVINEFQCKWSRLLVVNEVFL